MIEIQYETQTTLEKASCAVAATPRDADVGLSKLLREPAIENLTTVLA
jgi:hypothetical protein